MPPLVQVSLISNLVYLPGQIFEAQFIKLRAVHEGNKRLV